MSRVIGAGVVECFLAYFVSVITLGLAKVTQSFCRSL